MYRKNTAGQFLCVQMILTATGAVGTGVTLAARRCLDGTFGAGGGTFTEDGSTGSYKYAMAQADTNANNVSIIVSGTGVIPQCINFVTTAADPTDSVRLGLTALPNAAANAAGGLPVSIAGALDLDEMNVDIEAIEAKTVNLPAAPASTTNITAGTITTVTSLTNAAAVTSNIKKNSAGRITFVMTDSTTHAPKTGCTVTAQVSLDGVALGSCVNSPSEIGSGLYTLVLAAADTNANELAYRLTASSADDLVIERVTQP